jgi:DNA-binding MurR/RpiR family transcriptional regulator
MGKQAVLLKDNQMAAYALTPPVTGLILLAVSHSGETQFPIAVALQAREAGVKSIALTNEPASELGRAATFILPTQAVESARGSYAIAPRICQLAVLDLLFCGVAEFA